MGSMAVLELVNTEHSSKDEGKIYLLRSIVHLVCAGCPASKGLSTPGCSFSHSLHMRLGDTWGLHVDRAGCPWCPGWRRAAPYFPTAGSQPGLAGSGGGGLLLAPALVAPSWVYLRELLQLSVSQCPHLWNTYFSGFWWRLDFVWKNSVGSTLLNKCRLPLFGLYFYGEREGVLAACVHARQDVCEKSNC